MTPAIAAPDTRCARIWTREDAIVELLRGRLALLGPVTAAALGAPLGLSAGDTQAALLSLESDGIVLRGSFTPGSSDEEWCDRRLLARIHRLTLNRLRAEIEPVTPRSSCASCLRGSTFSGAPPDGPRRASSRGRAT